MSSTEATVRKVGYGDGERHRRRRTPSKREHDDAPAPGRPSDAEHEPRENEGDQQEEARHRPPRPRPPARATARRTSAPTSRRLRMMRTAVQSLGDDAAGTCEQPRRRPAAGDRERRRCGQWRPNPRRRIARRCAPGLDHQRDHGRRQKAEKEHQSSLYERRPPAFDSFRQQQRGHREMASATRTIRPPPEVERLDEQDGQDGHDDEDREQRARRRPAPAQKRRAGRPVDFSPNPNTVPMMATWRAGAAGP